MVSPASSSDCSSSLREPLTSPPAFNHNGSGSDSIIVKYTENWHVTKATEWHNDPTEDYIMTAKNRGICLIINNVKFDSHFLSQRKGSDLDAFRFKTVFQQLGFEVDSRRNLSAEKMQAAFKQTAHMCGRKHNALVVILLSHGTETGIYGADGIEVDLNDIFGTFDNRRCVAMKGKPKVFIIQACRGRQTDYGVRETQAFFSQPDSQNYAQPSQLSQFSSQQTKRATWIEVDHKCVPTRTDMLLCFASQTGYTSTRNEEEGSWLGASLAVHLENEAHNRHIEDIFKMVNRDISRRKSQEGFKQVLEWTSIGFDKHLYFNPGLSH